MTDSNILEERIKQMEIEFRERMEKMDDTMKLLQNEVEKIEKFKKGMYEENTKLRCKLETTQKDLDKLRKQTGNKIKPSRSRSRPRRRGSNDS